MLLVCHTEAFRPDELALHGHRDREGWSGQTLFDCQSNVPGTEGRITIAWSNICRGTWSACVRDRRHPVRRDSSHRYYGNAKTGNITHASPRHRESPHRSDRVCRVSTGRTENVTLECPRICSGHHE